MIIHHTSDAQDYRTRTGTWALSFELIQNFIKKTNQIHSDFTDLIIVIVLKNLEIYLSLMKTAVSAIKFLSYHHLFTKDWQAIKTV